MPLNEAELRKSLEMLAARADTPRLAVHQLVRRVRRRRAWMMGGAAGCAAAVAATAIAFPLTLGGPGQQPTSGEPLPPQAATAGTGSWGGPLTCGGRVPEPLPGPSGGGIRLTVGTISRSPSGAVQATPFMVSTLPHNAGPPMGPIDTVLLVLRHGVIVAAQRIPQVSGNFEVPTVGLNIPASRVRQDAPQITVCQPADWQTVWDHPQDYQVAVLMTAWIAGGGHLTDYRLAVTAPLPGS
jgi:hypothetical protein